jgi:hypothetical protein
MIFVLFLFFSTNSLLFHGGFSMTSVINDGTLSIDCQAEVSDGVLRYTGTFTRSVSLVAGQNELDFIIDDIERINQEIKRNVSVLALEAADRNIAGNHTKNGRPS